MVFEHTHAPYLEAVPFKTISFFTILQLFIVGGIYGLTWAGLAGVLFPIPIMLLVPFRQFIMPRLFDPTHLDELDKITEEAVDALPHEEAIREAEEQGFAHYQPGDISDIDVDPVQVLESEISHGRIVHHTNHADIMARRRHFQDHNNNA